MTLTDRTDVLAAPGIDRSAGPAEGSPSTAIACDPEAGTVAGLDAATLVGRYGSPLFVYDLDAIAGRATALRRALPARFDVAYALKANPSLAVVAHLARAGIGGDVASGGELEAALRAGVPSARIVFTGPGKTDDELLRALRAVVRAITVESLEELDRLIDLAAGIHDRPHAATIGPQGVLLRRADASVEEPVPILGGLGADKFGLTDNELDEAGERLAALGPRAGLRLDGMHAFGASNVRDAGALADHLERTVAFAADHSRRHGYVLRLVDAGGGLGIPYATGESELDVATLGSRLADADAWWSAAPLLQGTRILLEPGRFIAGPGGAYLCRVIATKRRGGTLVAIVDGGIHHLLRPALLGQPNRIEVLSAAGRQTTTVTVAGPLCTGLDVLAAGISLPEPRAGDLLLVRDTGAYGFSESMPLFLSHPQPAEVGLLGGEDRLIRPRVEPSEVLERQRLPW